MGSYKLTLKKSVEKDIRKIGREHIPRIVAGIESLAENPFPPNSRKLVGATHSHRLRVGEYRVVYLVDESSKAIEVQRVRHRKDVYR